jgi:hypothetical protein
MLFMENFHAWAMFLVGRSVPTETSRRMRGFSPLKGFMKKADYESVVAWTPWTPRTRRPPGVNPEGSPYGATWCDEVVKIGSSFFQWPNKNIPNWYLINHNNKHDHHEYWKCFLFLVSDKSVVIQNDR